MCLAKWRWDERGFGDVWNDGRREPLSRKTLGLGAHKSYDALKYFLSDFAGLKIGMIECKAKVAMQRVGKCYRTTVNSFKIGHLGKRW